MANTYEYKPHQNPDRERRRALAQAMMQRGMSAQSYGGGAAPIYGKNQQVSDLMQTLTGALMNRKLAGEETADRSAYNKTMAEALRGPQAPVDGMGPVEDKNEYLIKTLAGNEQTAPTAMQLRLAQMQGGDGGPAEMRTFNEMTKGLSDDERNKARRVALGLEARPSSAMPWLNMGGEYVQPATGRRMERGLPPERQPENVAAEATAKAGAELAAEQSKKVPALTNLDYLDAQFKDIQAKTSTGGPLGVKGIASRGLDYQNTQRFNNLREQISTELRTIFRIPGEGTLSDREMAQYGLQLPDIKNDPEINNQIMTDIKTRAGNRLGQGEAGGDSNVIEWNSLGR